MDKNSNSIKPGPGKEVFVILIYYVLYQVYLFIHPENELMHWVTLVLLPFGLLYFYQKKTVPESSFKTGLISVGFKKGNLKKGILWAIVLGVVLSCLQLYFSESRDEIWIIVKSGKIVYMFPMVIILMLVTAGFTEEFFFRGILQTRLSGLFKSNIWGIVFTSLLFGVYHVPYAYLNPSWSSYDNLSVALQSAMFQGGIGGIILGLVYVLSKSNLLACIIVHTLINSFPAMTMIKFSKP